MNLKTLFEKVHDGKTGLEFFQEYNIIPRKPLCDKGHVMRISFARLQPEWRCYSKTCLIKKGVRHGTWLQDSRLPLHSIAHFIYCWSKEMTTIGFCKDELGMSHGSAVDWNNFLRGICLKKLERMDAEEKMIGGPNAMVEIDVTLLTHRKDVDGNIAPNICVVAGLCLESKQCFVVKVTDDSPDTIIPILKQYVRSRSTIICSNWKALKSFQMTLARNRSVEDIYNFIDPTKVPSSQHAKMWGSAKWGNKKRRGTHKDHMESYFAEFMWRSKLNGRDPFIAILEDLGSLEPDKF